MPLSVVVTNRQRKRPVKLDEVQRMAELLAEQVCKNLKQDACPWLSAENIKDIEERGSFSLTLVSDRKIRELNRQWREKDRATDVLSFPIDDPADPPPPGMPLEIGEITVSIERADEQAQEYGHGFERELAFLMVHGMLHVLGFDHMTPAEEKEMFGRQRQILDRSGFTRGS